MACRAVNYWTFSELVVAFLDLLIAYCLLWASAFSFLASKFLGLFGLCLPCPCDGQFWNPTSFNHCLQKHFVDCPYEKISMVRSSVRTKFPLESAWVGGDDMIERSDAKLAGKGKCRDGSAEAEFGASSSSFKLGAVDLDLDLEGPKEEELGVKAKRVVGRRLRHGLRRRRVKGGFASYGNVSSVLSLDTPQSPQSVSKVENDGPEDHNDFEGDIEALEDFGSIEKASLGLELDDPNDDNKHFDGRVVLVEESGGDLLPLGDKNKKNTVSMLEKELEEERAAHSALYLELEKERSAAASAADEAMAMILRLQEEKASIEMEARQYQRMIEAKANYDAEEMNILKEILLRREREKHFLEKEVEAYRQMVSGNYQSDSDAQDVANTPVRNSTLYLSEDPILILHQINDSIEKPKLKIMDGSADYEASPIKSLNRTLAFGKELAIPERAEDDATLKQVGMHEHNSLSHFLSGNQMSHEFRDQGDVSKVSSITPFSEDTDQAGSSSMCTDLASKASDEESSVYDVHIVDDESKTLNAANTDSNERQSVSATLNAPRKIGTSSASGLTQYGVSRSCSDISSGLPPLGYLSGKTGVADFRRNSMSAVDYERVKIDNEVEWLTERLKIVQKGRENLNFSPGHKERGRLQLQVLEDITRQLRDIRKLNEPGKAERQASLPPSNSKVTSKKRRCRGASLNVHRST